MKTSSNLKANFILVMDNDNKISKYPIAFVNPNDNNDADSIGHEAHDGAGLGHESHDGAGLGHEVGDPGHFSHKYEDTFSHKQSDKTVLSLSGILKIRKEFS